MKIDGDAVLHAPLPAVWNALLDPAVLVATLPGCERLDVTGPHRYDMTVTAGVASIRDTYVGTVALSELQEPSSLVLTAQGAGASGTIAATVQVALAGRDDGTTALRYAADAQVGGVIGGVGQRLLGAAGRRTAAEFFSALNGALSVPGGMAAADPTDPTDPADVGGGPGPANANERHLRPTSPDDSAVRSGRAAAFIRPRSGEGDFARGVVTGGVLMLVGVVAGTLLGRRRG